MDQDKQVRPHHDMSHITPDEPSRGKTWNDPKITRIKIKRTMFGAHSGTDSTVFTTPTH